MSKKNNSAQVVKNFLSKLAEKEKEAHQGFRVNENGDVVFNEFNEPTTITTEGINIVSHHKKYENFDSLNLYVMSDTHIACEEAQVEKVKRYIETILKIPNAVLALNGDLINFAIKDSVSDPYKQKHSILKSIEIITEMVEELDKQNRIIVNIWGNHDGIRSSKLVAITPTDKFVKNPKLNTPGIAVVNVVLKNKFEEGKTITLSKVFAHGLMAKGGALGTVMAGINLVKNMFGGVPDFVFLGHTHQNAKSSSIIFTPVFSRYNEEVKQNSKKVDTSKKRITSFAVPSAIKTETYAAQKGFPFANTDGSLVEFIQMKDKDSIYWEDNAIDLDILYSLENMMNKVSRRELNKVVKQLQNEEAKYYEKIGSASTADEKIQIYKNFESKNLKLLNDIAEKYKINEQQLEKHFGLK